MVSKMIKLISIYLNLCLAFSVAMANDWAEWRGPARDGVSTEKNLPDKWSPGGENLAWKAPYGGRSAPIVMGDHVYLQNSAGQGETLQERIMCFNADTGKLLWEHRFNIYLSDVPPHRVGWASPVGDPATGNVYVFGVGGNLISLNRDGKVLWERSIGEDFGLLTTHGGRTVSPIIDGDLVTRRAPFHGVRQKDGRDCLRECSGRPPVRYDLRASRHRKYQRHTAADSRRQRRRGPRHQTTNW
jgi:outer membrane protein assembly factor BamB